MPKYYSVYDRETDMPIAIHKKAKECAEALHITVESFYTQVTRSRNGHPTKIYEIFEDEEEPEEIC